MFILFIPIIFISFLIKFPDSLKNKFTIGIDFPISAVLRIGSSLDLKDKIFLIFRHPEI